MVDHELHRAFVFLNDARMADSKEYKQQLWTKAICALERAKQLEARVPKDLVPPYWNFSFSEVQSRLSKINAEGAS